jgi:hypothetical protein
MKTHGIFVALAVMALSGCGGTDQAGSSTPASAATSALASAQAAADATRAARARAQADGIEAARAFDAAHGSPKAAPTPDASLLGPRDENGYANLDWSHMVPPEDIKTLENAPPVLHVGNQRMKQFGTLHTVAALNNQKVKISGYVVPLESDDDGKMVEFFFVPFYGACIHVPPPPPNMLIHVKLVKGIDTPSLYNPFTLSGVLRTEVTQNAMAASAYDMIDASLGTYREADSDADRLRQAFE